MKFVWILSNNKIIDEKGVQITNFNKNVHKIIYIYVNLHNFSESYKWLLSDGWFSFDGWEN